MAAVGVGGSRMPQLLGRGSLMPWLSGWGTDGKHTLPPDREAVGLLHEALSRQHPACIPGRGLD